MDMTPWNSTPEGSPTFEKVSGWKGIISIKTERTQIHFLSDVLIAVVSLDLKVPIVLEDVSSLKCLPFHRPNPSPKPPNGRPGARSYLR